ncbi:hypothetical protein [Alteribacter keqinensis]|uniref:Uncharacterized protein n=1 Tax=Alteribacter keqinensis TaxID=2483800 RepID=A0A3M7TWB6_9BACI|nr:hypothetical protein [Alteribacter keqinensis]RNA69907.1 hypothetical protein EBO34_08235 [Alteribacter keqinensis]
MIIACNIALLFLLSIMNTGCIDEGETIGSEDDIPGLVEKNAEVLSYGLYGENSKIIDTYLSDSQSDDYSLLFEMGQYFEEDIEFGMLVLENFEQMIFEHDEATYEKLNYIVPSNSIEQIEFHISPSSNEPGELRLSPYLTLI